MPAESALRQPDPRAEWFAQPIALRLVHEELRELIPLLTAHIGVRGLYLRPVVAVAPELSGNMLQLVTSVYRVEGGFDGDLRFDETDIPFGNDSLSLVYALHAIENSHRPAALLAECARILAPDGALFLVALSPFSAWRARWQGGVVQAWSAPRIRSILEGLGLSVEIQFGIGPIWPSLGATAHLATSERAITTSALDPLRAGFLLLARKRRVGLTPLQRGRRFSLRVQARPG